MLDGGEYSPSPEPFSCVSTLTNSRKKKSKNKRRFTDEQIRSLETMFESESRLEPRKKLQVARDLGLQPRQVAIWFQNRRARWKSKQLERDCSILQANYNSLASRFETLKKEKQALLLQLQKLNELMQKTQGERQNIETKFEVKPCLSLENSEPGGLGVLSDDDSSIKAEYFGIDNEEHNFMSVVKPADSSLTSPEDWGSFDSDGLFDQSSNNCQWWDFWS